MALQIYWRLQTPITQAKSFLDLSIIPLIFYNSDPCE